MIQHIPIAAIAKASNDIGTGMQHDSPGRESVLQPYHRRNLGATMTGSSQKAQASGLNILTILKFAQEWLCIS